MPDLRARFPLQRRPRLGAEDFAARAGVHPDLVRRLVALGLLEPSRDSRGRWWFVPEQVRTVARIQRLRAGLSVNYAALGLVMDLLDRVDALEAALRRTGVPVPARTRSPGATARLER